MIIDICKFKSFPHFKERFLSYLPKNYKDNDTINSCWNWEGTMLSSHYGIIWYGQKFYLAHRISYIIFNGIIKLNQVVRHTCDNRCCVNPKHLILGNHSDNSIDAVKRNRRIQQKLNEEAVKVIKWMLKYKPKKGLTKKLSELHNVSGVTITDISKNRTWSWIKV